MHYGESTDVADTVRMIFESTDVQPRRQHGGRPRRDYGESTQTLRRLRWEYTQAVRTARTQYGCIVQVRTQYGRPRCSGGFKVRQLWLWQLIRFLYSDRALREPSKKKIWQTQDERKLLLIHAAVSAMATGGCSYAPSVASMTGSFLGDCCPPFFRLCSATRLANPAAWPTLSYTHCFAAARCFMLQDLRYQVPLTLDPRHEVLGGV